MTNQDKRIQSDLLRASSKNPQLFNTPVNESGPQFGLENSNEKKEKFRDWINKYGSSVVLPIVALIILASGIYLYTNQRDEQAKLFPENNLAGIHEQLPGNPDQGIVADPNQEISQDTVQDIIPQSRKEGNNIIEKAAPGEGVTHLARRALKDYLNDNDQELTNEHKIYIEDYLKDKTSSQPLEVGEEVTFSEDLINEAIDASLELTPEQLNNLEQYSVLVAW